MKWQDLLSFLEWLCNNLNPVWLEPGETQHLYMDLIDAVANVSVRVPELGLQSARCGFSVGSRASGGGCRDGFRMQAGRGAECRLGCRAQGKGHVPVR